MYITGNQRQVENAYADDAFGNLKGQVGELLNRILYTGQQYDQEMGQYYLRARYYNPVIGRFTQEDVYRGDGLNLYTYCKNNPVTYYDPSGFCGEDNCGGRDKTEDVNNEGTGETGSHHTMRGEIYRDGELIYGDDYVSGGGVGGYRDGLLHHTERKFLNDTDVIVQSNDSIVMQGEMNPCKPG